MANETEAIFEWESPDLQVVGTIVFSEIGEPMRNDWVRHICSSVTLEGLG